MPKPVKPMRSKPIYRGERSSATNTQQVHMCVRCDRLATHRCQKLVFDGTNWLLLDRYMCEWHMKDAIKTEGIRKVRALPEWRRFNKRLAQWNEQQRPEKQESLL